MLAEKLQEAAGNGIASTLYVDDVFSTWLYDGAGASQTVNNGIDLAGKGGMVWIKQRNGLSAHNLRDTVRGNNYALNSALTNAQSSGWSTVFNFTSTGYAITGTNDQYNGAGGTYAAWTFRKAAKFFDVVTYTGTGSARTIAHSLGVAPGMVIVKRTDTTGDWQVYSNGLTSAAYSIQLNLTAAQASAPTVWNSTAPTSSVFSVGTDATVNASGGTYVAYLFAHDTSSTGIIQCGSIVCTTNSVPQYVNLGWEPQYVLIKNISDTKNWDIFDSMRGMTATSTYTGNPLFANTSGVEISDDALVTVSSLGFSIQSNGDIPTGGANGNTYIYLAIRRPNKPPTTGTQVFQVQSLGDSTSGTLGLQVSGPSDMVISRYGRSVVGDNSVASRLTGYGVQNYNLSTTNTPALITSSTAAEARNGFIGIDTGNFITTWLASSTAGGMVSYFLARAPGFFDVVCYTGTGSATTQAHNLTVAPELMFVKKRDTNGDWLVYNGIVGNGSNYLVLNLTDAQSTNNAIWNGVAPTSSVFSIGINSNVNAASSTYVAYLFATLAGISKVGSYTGNGSSQNINCGFAAGARFFLVKATSTTGSWWVWDSARGITAGNDPALQLNSTAAEITTADAVDPYSPGITVNQEATCSINASGVSYIFLAVA